MIFHEQFDLIVAIGRGGIIPARLISLRLKLPFNVLHINYRNSENKIIRSAPVLLGGVPDIKNKTVLLVDDVSRSGETLKAARQLLKDARAIKTFAINGRADYMLYDEPCFQFPWPNLTY